MKIPLHRNAVGLLQNYLVLFIEQRNKLREKNNEKISYNFMENETGRKHTNI